MIVKPISEDRRSLPEIRKLVTESAMETRDLTRFVEKSTVDSKFLVFPGESERLAMIKTAEIEHVRSVSYIHSQVLRIREEDSHLGEDIGEGLSTKDKLAFSHISSHTDALLYSRPILPSSPLGNKTAIKSFH